MTLPGRGRGRLRHRRPRGGLPADPPPRRVRARPARELPHHDPRRASRSGCRRSGRRSRSAARSGWATGCGSWTTSPLEPDGTARLGRLAAYVRDRRVPLELCPTSNVHTGGDGVDRRPPDRAAPAAPVPGHRQHRQPADERRLRVAEFQALDEAFGIGLREMEWLTINALKSAFTPVRRAAGADRGRGQAGLRATARRRDRDRPVRSPVRALPVRTADVVIVGAGVQGASLAFHLARRGAAVARPGPVVRGRRGDGSLVGVRADALRPGARGGARLALVPVVHGLGRPRRGGGLRLRADRVPAARAGGRGRRRCGRTWPRSRPWGSRHRAVDAAECARTRAGDGRGRRGRGGVGAAVRLRGPDRDRGGVPRGGATARRGLRRRCRACRRCGSTASGSRAWRPAAGWWTRRWSWTRPGRGRRRWRRSVGVEVPVIPWRHDTAYLGLPAGHPSDLPIVLDHAGSVYFRPEGSDLLLAGLEDGNELGGSPDRPLEGYDRATSPRCWSSALCARVPWMAGGDFRSANRGQDGMTPDQRPVSDRPGLTGSCSPAASRGPGSRRRRRSGRASRSGSSTARRGPWTCGRSALERFAEGRLLVGEHPYRALWR